MTAKATGEEQCPTLTIQNTAKPASSETPAIQILQAGTSSEMLLSSESGLSKITAAFWNSNRL